MNKIPEEISFFLNYEKVSFILNYGGSSYYKVPLNENYVVLYTGEYQNPVCIFIYSLKSQEAIISFCKTPWIPEDIYYKNVIKKVQESIKEEFKNLSTFIKPDNSLLTQTEIQQKAFDLFWNNKKAYFTVPDIINSYDLFSVFDYIEITNDLNEFAYNQIENHLNSNKGIVEDYQQYLAIEQLRENYENLFDKQQKMMETFSQISSCGYKTVTLVRDVGDSLETVKVSCETFPYLQPSYSIVKILHGRTVLYERNIHNLEDYQLNVLLNLNEFEKMKRNQTLRFFKTELLENKEFFNKVLDINPFLIDEFSEKKFANKDFVLNLLKVLEIHKCLSLYNKLSHELKLDKDLCMKFLEKDIDIFAIMPLEIQKEESFLQYVFRHGGKGFFEKSFPVKMLKEKERYIKVLFDEFCVNSSFILPNHLLVYITDKDIALTQVYSSLDTCNFKFFNEDLRQITSFIYEYIMKLQLSGGKKTTKRVNFDEIYNYLTEDQKQDENLIEFLSTSLNINISTSWRSLDKKFKTEQLARKVIIENKRMLFFFDMPIQKKLVLENPDLLEYSSSLLGYYFDNEDFWKELIKENPFKIKDLKGLRISTCKILIEENPEIYRYLPDEFQVNSEILLLLEDKFYILPYLPIKTKQNCKSHPIDNKNFVLKQLKLGNGDLSYIPMSSKKNNNFSLLDDKDIIEYSISLNPNNAKLFPNNLWVWEDENMAEFILTKCPFVINKFKSNIKANKVLLTKIYNNIPFYERNEFLNQLPKRIQKEIKY